MHFICIFLGAEDANVTLFWVKSLCLWPFHSIYCLACCINKKWCSLITFMKMNLQLLLLCTSSNGNTTLEWTTKADRVSHSTYSMQSNRKEFLFSRTTLAFHGTENWLCFSDSFVFFMLYGALTWPLYNLLTRYFPLARVQILLS